MVTLTLELDWTYEHFLTYILFVVASADLSVDHDELIEIKTILTTEGISEEEYSKIKDEVLSKLALQSTLRQKETFIKSNKDYFLDCEEKKEQIVSSIEDVIAADLSVDENEFITYRTIKAILLG